MARANHYEVLGVRAGAAAAEIQRAYRALAKKLHPDVSKEPDAQKRFAAVARAYEVLSNPEKRRGYDRRLERRGAVDQTDGLSGARGHYSWRNIATEQTPERNGTSGARERTELDELYDTYFGKRAQSS